MMKIRTGSQDGGHIPEAGMKSWGSVSKLATKILTPNLHFW